jgi:hypothetical protein
VAVAEHIGVQGPGRGGHDFAGVGNADAVTADHELVDAPHHQRAGGLAGDDRALETVVV